MKKVFLKKARLVSAVMIATAGMSFGTVAQADSLLAPLVISDAAAGFETYFALKMKGSQSFSAGGDNLHYVWIKKGTSVNDLGSLGTPCLVEDNTGRGSKGDVVYQSVRTAGALYTGGFAFDGSSPATYSAGDFVGMTVISDVSNESDGGSGTPEGDMSGFGYIVNAALGSYQDYKLLNNHHSAEDGNFKTGFISKHVVDFMWMGSSANAGTPITGWTMSVTGPDMSKHTGGYNSTYGLTVKVSQDQRDGEDSPENAIAGAYDNDESIVSGDRPMFITCMGTFTKSGFLTPLQNSSSQDGGWTRKSIIPQADAYAGTNTAKVASGALTYRADTATVVPGPSTTLQIETGGHLAPGNNHANRPY